MPVMFSPQNSTDPAVGLICPRMLLNSVVLPEPFGPMTPTISPGPTDKVTPSTALIAPYDFFMSLTSRNGVIAHFRRTSTGPPAKAVHRAETPSARLPQSRRSPDTSPAGSAATRAAV